MATRHSLCASFSCQVRLRSLSSAQAIIPTAPSFLFPLSLPRRRPIFYLTVDLAQTLPFWHRGFARMDLSRANCSAETQKAVHYWLCLWSNLGAQEQLFSSPSSLCPCIISAAKGNFFPSLIQSSGNFERFRDTSSAPCVHPGVDSCSGPVTSQYFRLREVFTGVKGQGSLINRCHQSGECPSFDMHESWRAKCIFNLEQWVSVTPLQTDTWQLDTVAGYTLVERELQASKGVKAKPLHHEGTIRSNKLVSFPEDRWWLPVPSKQDVQDSWQDAR